MSLPLVDRYAQKPSYVTAKPSISQLLSEPCVSRNGFAWAVMVVRFSAIRCVLSEYRTPCARPRPPQLLRAHETRTGRRCHPLNRSARSRPDVGRRAGFRPEHRQGAAGQYVGRRMRFESLQRALENSPPGEYAPSMERPVIMHCLNDSR